MYFFCAGSKLAKILAPKIAKYSTVIEHSKHFRMLKDIPLIIPEVNEHALKNYKKKFQTKPKRTIKSRYG